MEALGQYVIVLVMLICLAVGYIIKHSLNFIPNRFIPLILGALGVVINVWIAKGTFTPEILLGGLASGLASTGAFELTKNMMSKDKNSAELVSLIKKTLGNELSTKDATPSSEQGKITNQVPTEEVQKDRNNRKVKEHKKSKDDHNEIEAECKEKKDKKHE